MKIRDFYDAAFLMLSRVGYIIDVEPARLASGDADERQRGKWIDRGVSALGWVGVEVPWYRRDVLMKFDLSENDERRLKSDWQELTAPFPVAGLRYAHGQPIGFGARVSDPAEAEGLAELLEETHGKFGEFCENHRLAISRSVVSVFVICLAFADRKRFELGKGLLGGRRSKAAFFKRANTVTWLLDLESLEIASPKGINAAALRMTDSVVSAFGRRRRTESLAKWTPPGKALTQGIIGERSFTEFFELFAKTPIKKRPTIPGRARKRIEAREREQRGRRLRARLGAVEQQMEGSFFALGESLLARFEAGEKFKGIITLLRRAARTSATADGMREKLTDLEALRHAWSESLERSHRIEIEKVAAGDRYVNSCKELGVGLFKRGQALLKKDRKLARLFAEPKRLRLAIDKRKREMKKLEGQQEGGLVAAGRAKARRLLLRRRNRKEQRELVRRCEEVGERAYKHLPGLPERSPLRPLWSRIGRARQASGECEESLRDEERRREEIAAEVEGLAGSRLTGDYPWEELEEELERGASELADQLVEPLTRAGEKLWRSGRALGGKAAKTERALARLDKEARGLSRQLGAGRS